MLWAAVAKFCSISRMKVSAAFSRASCLRLGRICGISPRSRSPRDALAPDAGETSQSQQEKFPVTDVFKYVEVTDGRVWMRPEGVACFAGDLSEEDQKVVWATHYAPAADLFSRNAPGTAWKSKPSWYIVANHDRSPSGPGTLLGEADGRYHLCCRQQPRRDAFPSQPGHRRYPCRRKGRSRIIRYGVRCVAATTADTKV